MTPERWAQIRQIFHAALEKPKSGRDTFLEEACRGDLALRREVDNLLAEQDSPSLTSPAEELLTHIARAKLEPGQTLAQYRVGAKLGEGGMGAVYRAYDTRLDRDVALKVLSPEHMADPERRQRLMREARAASALNHPNIVTVHEIGSERGVDFIAMEYVEGRSLAEAIPAKGLPLARVLEYAIATAGALAKAHAAGVIHRDLKPANIMVTSDGQVKLLDFGLARRVRLSESESTTLTLEGEVAGTPAYMSPEQAEGKPLDARSDVFSFGVVLYQMLTGRRAFAGDSAASILAGVLREEPAPLGEEIPRDLKRIVQRCLRKDPARRFQHMADVKVELKELKEHLESDSGKLLLPEAGARTPRRRKILRALTFAGFAIILLASLGLWFWLTPQAARTIPHVAPITSYPGSEISPSFSPDGNQVAFAWNNGKNDPIHTNFDIYLKLIDGSDPVRLTHDPADEFSPAWSPDGRYIAFLRTLSAERAGVFVIPAIGGRERKLVDVYQGPSGPLTYSGLSWFPDGKSLAVVDRASPLEPSALFMLSLESGEKRRLTSPPQRIAGDESPAVSPDGQSLVFSRSVTEDLSDLFLLELAADFTPKGEPTQITFENRYSDYPVWSPNGRTIVFTSGARHTPALWEIRLSRPWSRAAKPERLLFAGDGVMLPAISRQGHLAYSQFAVDVDIWKLDLDGDRPAQRPPVDLISSTRVDHEPQYSPDGKRIVFGSNRSGSFEIWVCNADGSNAEQLTSFASSYYAAGPKWSPDGGLIYFNYDPEGKAGAYVISSEGGRPKHLDFEGLDAWSRDGEWIYFSSNRGGEEQIWRMPARGGEKVQVTRKGGNSAVESPDGKFLYYLKGPGDGAGSLWRLPLAGGEEIRVLESVLNDNFAVVDRGIYFIPDAKPFSIRFMNFATSKVVTIAKIPREPSFGFSVSPDSRSLLFAEYEAIRSDLMLVRNFR